jgi:HK97 gp10 family phage protein
LSDSISIKFDTGKLDAAMNSLRDGVEALTRPAAQAGAQIFYDEMRRLVPVAEKGHTTKSGREIPPGTLQRSIYQKFSVDNSGKGHSTYHITWNRKKAPHGHLIEYGHWTKKVGKYGPLKPKWVPAHPFQRPAFDHMKAAATQAANAVMEEGLKKLLAGTA